MLHDKGINDSWIRPRAWRRMRGGYALTLTETLGQSWPRELVSYPLPAVLAGQAPAVTREGQPVPSQVSEGRLHFLVEDLAPAETRVYQVRSAETPAAVGNGGVSLVETKNGAVFSNGVLSLRLPATGSLEPGRPVPGPLLAVRRGPGPWLGRGRLESPFPAQSITTRLVESGPLWTAAEVTYAFAGGYGYRVRLLLRPGDEACEVREESTLPVRLWPATRPGREIGTLGASGWTMSPERQGAPVERPCPTSNFVFDLRAGWTPDRLVTHSTGSVEILDLPLQLPWPKAYTALRPSLSYIDGGWLGVYASGQDDLVGVASIDIAHWQASDDRVHPMHRTPGTNTEVALIDSRETGTHLRFPVESVQRRWLLAVVSRAASQGLAASAPAGESLRLPPNVDSPLWALRRRRGDLRLDKVKDWVVDWPTGFEPAEDTVHPRLYCGPEDLPAIRAKINAVPELRAAYEATRDVRPVDRYIVEGEAPGLDAIEAATHAEEYLQRNLDTGYACPQLSIGVSRNMRRYVVACDLLWPTFTPEEKRRARRTMALAAYMMTDGDWWQYAWREGETTYLPNFNSDSFTCVGHIAVCLPDHPCARAWLRYFQKRLDLDLQIHEGLDGNGAENIGNYMPATWMMLLFPSVWMLTRNGLKDYSASPYVVAAARYLLAALGPADRRDRGRRQLPPIGHHPFYRKDVPLLAWFAALLRQAEPELAGQLMWAWRSMGAPVRNFYDHNGYAANPLTRQYIYHDPTLPELAPALPSAAFPRVGAVLRSHGADARGSYLFHKAGRTYSHHDDDEGSFHYFGRGVPLALDGLTHANGAPASGHNQLSFSRPGQPTGHVEVFTTSPAADYLRTTIAPRAFNSDAMYQDDMHRSGWTRELLLVKAPAPGGLEYLVVKDTAVGPDCCQWNLDVLSRRPRRLGEGRIWFPGHPEFDMGLEVFLPEPAGAELELEKGFVDERVKKPKTRAELGSLGFLHVDYAVTEHWLLHVPAGAGETFLAVLFPRRPAEPAPAVEYLPREETLRVTHQEGQELIFLRPNVKVDALLDGVYLRGRAGLAYQRGGRREIYPLDALEMRREDYPGRNVIPL